MAPSGVPSGVLRNSAACKRVDCSSAIRLRILRISEYLYCNEMNVTEAKIEEAFRVITYF